MDMAEGNENPRVQGTSQNLSLTQHIEGQRQFTRDLLRWLHEEGAIDAYKSIYAVDLNYRDVGEIMERLYSSQKGPA